MNRLAKTFEHCHAARRGALITYITAGVPNIAVTEKLLIKAAKSGADVIELGVPFSDPTADGTVIQEASQQALDNGISLRQIINCARNARTQCDVPIILFSYYNVMLNYGLEKLAGDCANAGIDGVLAVDLPFEHMDELRPALDKYNLALIPLVAPTTPPERAKKIVANATGFVYCITAKGVTGGHGNFDPALLKHLQHLRTISPVPVAAGFGIDSPERARELAPYADALVVGSAIVRKILDAPDDQKAIDSACNFIKKLADSIA